MWCGGTPCCTIDSGDRPRPVTLWHCISGRWKIDFLDLDCHWQSCWLMSWQAKIFFVTKHHILGDREPDHGLTWSPTYSMSVKGSEQLLSVTATSHQPTATPYQFPVQNNLSIFSLPLSARGNGNCLKQYSVAPRSGRCVCKVGRRYPRRDIELHYSNGGMCG